MKKALLILFTIIFISIIAVWLFLVINNRPVSTSVNQRNFSISQGEGLDTIGRRLQNIGFIRNKFSFMYYAYTLGLNNKLQAGNFKISQSLSTKEIVIKLSKGGTKDYWLKIKDGSRIEEISESFVDNGNFTSNEFVSRTKSREGYLYPDSYLIPQDYNINQILALIEKNFNQKFSQANEGKTNQNLNDRQIIILASLLEREGRSLQSKQMIAGILLNRLDIGMPLQVDAAVQYARDSKTKSSDYWKPLSKVDLQIESPFNTYKYPDLPPAPICNPGLNSIYAAFHPTKSDYLFYITGNDNQMHYAKTLEEHNQNIAKYLK